MSETEQKEPGKPVVSLVLGILGLFLWIIPLFGLPATVVGLVYGVNALKRQAKGMAIAGVALCSLGLAASGINCIWGAYLGATGQHRVVNRIMKR